MLNALGMSQRPLGAPALQSTTTHLRPPSRLTGRTHLQQAMNIHVVLLCVLIASRMALLCVRCSTHQGLPARCLAAAAARVGLTDNSHTGPCTTCSPGTRLEQVCVDPLEQHKPRRLGSAAGAILSSLSSGLATRLVYVAAQNQASTLFRHQSGQEAQPGGFGELLLHTVLAAASKECPSDGIEWNKAIKAVQEGMIAGAAVAAAFLRVLLALVNTVHRISDSPHKAVELRYSTALHPHLCVQHVYAPMALAGSIQSFHYAEAERGLSRHLICFATFQSKKEVQTSCGWGRMSTQHSTTHRVPHRAAAATSAANPNLGRLDPNHDHPLLHHIATQWLKRCVLTPSDACRCRCCCCCHSNGVPIAVYSQSQSAPSESAQHELPAVGNALLLLLYRGCKYLAPHKALPVPAKPCRPRPQTLVHHKPCQHSRQLHLDLPYV